MSIFKLNKLFPNSWGLFSPSLLVTSLQPVETRHVKYVFVDVVLYSVSRSVEAQTEIIATINKLVKEGLSEIDVDCDVVFIPTGDGICVAIIDRLAAFDIHLRFALKLLERLSEYNSNCSDSTRKFEIRIGLNENVDNLITDINGHRNVAGPGINTAQRIMNLGDGGSLIISESVFETLRHREIYLGKFKRFSALVKHDVELTVFQYVDTALVGLNCKTPFPLLNSEDPIDAQLRRCLTDHNTTSGMSRCTLDAATAWKHEFDKLKGVPIALLEESERELYNSIVDSIEKVLSDYQTLMAGSYAKFQGRMYRVFAASKRMQLAKSVVVEIRGLIEHLNERASNRREN